MRIITIGREFGSGGRELGKRLADSLNIPCYDKEVMDEIAKLHNIPVERVEFISESDISIVYPTTIGRSFASPFAFNNDAIKVLSAHHSVIRKLAVQGDCVFIGRSADLILSEYNPLNIFIYADTQSKINRCLARAKGVVTESEVKRQMKRIDKERAHQRKLLTDIKWGQRGNYHLMIDTSNMDIKALVPVVTAYAESFFKEN